MEKVLVKEVLNRLINCYPEAKPRLEFSDVYELLVAVILSAQCTDNQVNAVTDKLFREYNTPKKMLRLTQDELEGYIFSCGFYRNKAKNILAASKEIIENHGGEVPGTVEELIRLPGVGIKTANVVFSVGFGGDAIAVDTHVFRVSNRIGLSRSKNVFDCEEDLKKAIDKDMWSLSHHLLIFHGRNVCKARKPECTSCALFDICEKNFK